jgi:cytochrome b561
MTQYSKRMVIAHWLTLALLIAAWFLGDNLAEATDESKATLAGYITHGAVGAAILLLTVTRLFFRSKDGTPPAIGQTVMDKVAKGIHHALYTVLFVLPVSGIAILLTSKAGPALLAGDANMLPKEHDFHKVFAHEVHEQLVNVLIVLVVIHILGAIKHQFISKDGLMERMMLRRKG